VDSDCEAGMAQDDESEPLKDVSPETLAAQAMGRIEPITRAIVPPIHVSTTYQRDTDNRYSSGNVYSRADNPTYDQPEDLLNALEGGADALVFSSGMAAATALFQALDPGDHVVAPKVMYWSLRKWLGGMASRWGLRVELVDMSDMDALAGAVQPGRTKLVWVETPANPLWTITDIEAAAEIAHKAGARLTVDSTVATPVLTRPLSLGADLVMHSATKYLNGHSDVIAGALVAARDDDYWQRVRAVRSEVGGVPGPFEAAQLLRGMRTLYLRVERSSASAQAIAERLAGHEAVTKVLYPGLAGHPGHAIAARQMQGGFGGMLSIRVKNGAEAAIGAAARVRIWKRATSLGGVESFIEHRASIEGPDTPVPDDLLRLSVGIEDPADLIADLEQALGRITL
jgi:cystathionine gamma-synthase